MGKGSQTTTQNTSPDPQSAAAYRDLLTRASGVASTPYQSYTGQLVAPFNAQQNLGVSNVNANAGFAQPYIQDAAQYARNAAAPLSQSDIQQYINPYTQNVVAATQAQFNEQNQLQQQQLTGNAIARGSLGGNRTGVAQAELARQQQLSQAPVIAGLMNQGYQTGLNTALTQQQAQAQGAYSLGNLGVAGQQAGLSGAGAQFGVGAQQQATQQAQDTSGYQQYLQQLAYPFQTTQWLAGLQTGVGSQLGGTSTTTGPPPNQTGQIIGSGLAAGAFLLSDRQAKQNIQKVGTTNDGQPIYRYQYKGDPTWHVGLIAQEVEKRHPEAVHAGVGNLKAVDIKAATDDSVHRDIGGFVPGFDNGGMAGVPYSGVAGYVPSLAMAPWRQVSGVAPRPDTTTPDLNKMTQQIMSMANSLQGGTTGGNGLNLGGLEGFGAMRNGGGVARHFDDGGWVNPLEGGPTNYWTGQAAPTAGFAPVAQPAAPVTPDFVAAPNLFASEPMPGASPLNVSRETSVQEVGQDQPSPLDSAQWPQGPIGAPPGVSAPTGPTGHVPRGIRNNNPGNLEDGPFAQRQPGYIGTDGRFAIFATPDAGQLAASNLLSVYGSKGINTINGIVNRWAPATDNNNTATYAAAVAKDTGFSPDQPLNMDDPETRQKIAAAMFKVENGQQFDTAALPATAQPTGGVSTPGVMDRPGQQLTPDATQPGFGLNLMNMSPAAQQALLAAGLGMMASKSPNLGNVIGEGGITGLNAYANVKGIEHKTALENKKVDIEAKRLQETADRAAKALAEAIRHNLVVENQGKLKSVGINDQGFPIYLDTKTGQEIIGKQPVREKTPTGYVRNPDGTMAPIKGGPADPEIVQSLARAKNGAPLSDEASNLLADRVLAGDRGALIGLGRSKENILKVQEMVAKKVAAGEKINPAVREILINAANIHGLNAAERAFGDRTAKVELAVTEAKQLMPQVLKTSEAVDRTRFPDINSIILAAEKKTGDENVVRLGIAINSFINVYARAINPTGQVTVSDKDHARELLQASWSKGQIRAGLDQLTNEMNAAQISPAIAKEHVENLYRAPKTPSAPTGEPAAPTSTAAPKIGEEKAFKQGIGVWDGTKWMPKP